MSPRSYQLGARQSQIDDSRRKIVDSARALLSESTTFTSFTVDAVASRADVARATVYYQFKSKSGLLEALCDSLANEGQLSSIGQALKNKDSVEAVHAFIKTFARFWSVDRIVMRRLHALSILDPEVRTVIDARDDRRRQIIDVLLSRFAERNEFGPAAKNREIAKVLFSLTSFESFDSIAGKDQTLENATSAIIKLVDFALLG